jgi:ketosteroid isomerase-like protein
VLAWSAVANGADSMTTNSPNEEIQDIRRVAVRWTAAVEPGDLELLGRLMTEDIAVIHGNGRLVCGKEAAMNDFARSLQDFSVQQRVESEETIVAGEWAFDRAKVHTTISSRNGCDTKQFDSRSITILRKQGGLGWRVARVIGVIKVNSELRRTSLIHSSEQVARTPRFLGCAAFPRVAHILSCLYAPRFWDWQRDTMPGGDPAGAGSPPPVRCASFRAAGWRPPHPACLPMKCIGMRSTLSPKGERVVFSLGGGSHGPELE